MMTRITLFFFIAFVGLASANLANKLCLYSVNQTSVYNFIDFAQLQPSTVLVNGTNLDLTFHLCNRQVTSCGSKASNYGIVTEQDDKTFCQNLTPADMTSPNASFYDENDADQGVVLTFAPILNNNTNVTFKVELLCDNSIPTDQIQWSANVTNSGNDSVYTITGRGEEGCPATLAKFLIFFDNYYYIFAVAFIGIGLLSLVGGMKFFNTTIFVLTTVLVASMLSIVIFELTTVETTTTTKWVIFVICLLIGMAFGYLAIKVERVGFFALGALLGALGSLFLYNSVLHFLGLSDTLLYVIVAFISIIGGVVGVVMWKNIIILGTSCIGSYLVIRGISFLVGGFPNELEIAEGVTKFDYIAYAYLMAIILLSIGGIVYQWKHGKKSEDLEHEYQRESLIREEY